MNKNYIIAALAAVIVIWGGWTLINKPTSPAQVVEESTQTTPTSPANSPNPNVTVPTTPPSSKANPAPTPTPPPPKTTPSPAPSKNTGRVLLTLTDEVMGLSSIQSILLTVNEVAVLSPQGSWVSLVKTPRVFDLLDLHAKSKKELFADTNLTAGTYTALRITIGNVVVIQKDGLKNSQAKLPAQTITVNSKLVVEKGKTSGIGLDFDSGKALHKLIDGTLIFLPVVAVHTEHGVESVQITGGNVELFRGLTDYNQTVGMNEIGDVKAGYSLSSATKIEYLGTVVHLIPSDEQWAVIKVPAQDAVDTVIKNGYITSALSVQTVMREGKRVWQVIGVKGSSRTTVFLDIVTGAIIAVQ